ncbi:MAG: FAD:protein FMN transferase [Bacteroidota bacterium]
MKKVGLLLLVVIGCSKENAIRIEGETMATTYHITYFHHQDFRKEIDSLLILVNKSINTYDTTSEVSVFNKSREGSKFSAPGILSKAREVYDASGGAFDPTVMPLVNAWGFGPKKQAIPDSAKVDSLRSTVGFEKVQFNNDSVWKTDPRAQLDFGGIGQGYGADVIANFLKSKGVENMFVELGGEGLAIGRNLESGKEWNVAVLDPEDLDKFKTYVSLSDRSFTTSGNYYNYRIVNGQRFVHTIDPTTGYPVQSSILSVTVFAKDCTTADAWDTALMVMGHDKAIEMLKTHPELNGYIIYSTPDGTKTFATKGIERYLTPAN